MNIVLINARSLRPKLFSLLDTMNEMNSQIALVTETWFRESSELRVVLEDMSNALGFGVVREDRSTGVGGGVCLVYNKSEIEFQKVKIKATTEIVAAIGRRTGQRRKIAAVTAYIPPNYDAEQSDKALDEIVDVVGHLKRKYNSPYVVLGGDFNKRNIEESLKCFPDLKKQVTPPTRGGNVLDKIFTNFDEYITEAGVTDSIFNLEGTETDHKTVYINASMPRVPAYKTENYSYIQQTKAGDEKMVAFLESVNWGEEIVGEDTDGMVAALHSIFNEGMKRCYEVKKSSKKSSEPAWMTGGIRRLIRRRRAIFKKWGRNNVWKALKRKTRKLIRERKKTHDREKKEKILSNNSNCLLYTSPSPRDRQKSRMPSSA